MTDRGGKLWPGVVLSAAAHAGRQDWWHILAVAVPVSVISAGLEIVLEHYLDPSDASLSISATLAVTGVSLLGTVLLSGYVCGLAGATEHGRKRRTVAETVRSLPWKRLVAADLLVTVTVVVGLLLFVVPGLAALTLLAVVGPVIEIEHRHVPSAFRRSVHLVRQHVWLVILLGTVPLCLAAELEAVAPEPDRAGEIAEFLVLRGVVMGVIEACLALLLVEVCIHLIDSDRRNETAKSPDRDDKLAAALTVGRREPVCSTRPLARTGHASMGRMPADQSSQGGISARLVSQSAASADPRRLNDYDSFAEAYTASNETSLVNAYYERPAMLALAGDVAGRRILDAGCGSGPLFAALRDRGAIVTGIDKSAGMLEQARRRLGDDADLRVAELGDPLPFPDDTFDDVTASLILHYLEDWGPALAELRRVLRPGGRLIVSVNHPFAENMWHSKVGLEPDYFATYSYTAEWAAGGQNALLRFWARPLHAMIDAFAAAGFRIAVISEPAVAPDTPRELLPDDIAAGRRLPCFLFFVLHAGCRQARQLRIRA